MPLARLQLHSSVLKALSQNPVVSLLGPRQCGKTTLARAISAKMPSIYLDLESPEDLARLSQPQSLLSPLMYQISDVDSMAPSTS